MNRKEELDPRDANAPPLDPRPTREERVTRYAMMDPVYLARMLVDREDAEASESPYDGPNPFSTNPDCTPPNPCGNCWECNHDIDPPAGAEPWVKNR